MAAKKGKEIRERHASDRIFNAAVIILSITTFIVIAYPLWFIVIALISNSNMVNQGKVILWPVDIRFYGYQQILWLSADFGRFPYLDWLSEYIDLCSSRNRSESGGNTSSSVCAVQTRL